jgi:hypothetical protein
MAVAEKGNERLYWHQRDNNVLYSSVKMEGAMKTIRPLLAGLIVVLFVLLAYSASGSRAAGADQEPIPLPVWRHEVVDPGVAFFYLGAPSLALDPDGRPHAVYGQNALFHSWFDGAAWQTETLVPPPATMLESAIAIDSAGRIILVYNLNGKLYALAREPGEAWPAAVALPIPAGNNNLFLALDSDDRPRVAAGFTTMDEESFFHIASETPTGWAVETVSAAGDAGGPIRLALDSQARPVVLYAEIDSSDAGGDMWLARRDNEGVWQHELVAMGCIISSKWLALDAQDKAHIVYSEHCDGQMTYARQGDDGWELIPLPDAGASPSLALDTQGRPHVVYGAFEEGQVYAVLTDAGWQTTPVQAGEAAGEHNTLLLDEAGTAHIVSINASPGNDIYGVEYVTNAGGTWQISKLAAPVTVGEHNALALDVDDRPYVFYDKAEAGELWWGVKTAGWETRLLAEVTSLYLEVSAGVDSQGRPHVAYADQTADELVVGVREGGAWSLETIGPAGFYLSLAVGGDDSPRLIAARDGVLTYWFKEGDAWTSEQVGNPASYVSGAWFALDSQDRPHVVYGTNNGRFHAVRETGGQWTTEPLPWNTVGLALGPGDKLYVLHTSSRPARVDPQYDVITLWVAERDGVSWLDTPLAEYTNWWNLKAWIAVGENDEVHVVYRDVPGVLHYQERDENGDWLTVSQPWGNGEDVGLLVGHDGQPRLLTHNASSLILWTREILLLDQHVFLAMTTK